MRGKLFPEISEELSTYLETHESKENPYLSEDYELLKQHYSIVLDYVEELEEKLARSKKQINILNRKIKIMSEQETNDDVFDGVVSREKRKREELEKLFVECIKELNELREFKKTVITIFNKGD